MERAVLLHSGDVLEIGPEVLSLARAIAPQHESNELLPLAEVETRHIRSVLRHTNGRISGPNGAAKILDLNPSTLRSRMEKLNIKVERS